MKPKSENLLFKLSKPFLLFLSVVSLTLFVMGCGSGNTEENNLALEEIKTEPLVREALIVSGDILYASVIDDGTRRDGYAEYLCQILKEKGASISRVKITEVGTTKSPDRDNAYGVLLGEAHCN
jgi:hypothetical protein